jgi:hypothetical protein
MKRLLVSLLLLAASLGAQASGGGSSAPPPWAPKNTMHILFAFSKDMQTHERVCWQPYPNLRCKSKPAYYATEMSDYLNWVFEKQQVNLKITASGVGLGKTIDPRWYSYEWSYLDWMRQLYGAQLVFMVAPNDDSMGSSGNCGTEGTTCWFSDAMVPFTPPPRQVMAHEFGHYLYLHHRYEKMWDKVPPHKSYAGGHGTWAWVDLMGKPGENGRGLIKYDIYSDHEHWCGFDRCGIQNYESAGQYLREVWGRYVRPGGSPPKPPRFPDGGHAGNGRN